MLQIAATELEKEQSRREAEKQNYLSEHCPPLHIPGSASAVQVPPPSRQRASCCFGFPRWSGGPWGGQGRWGRDVGWLSAHPSWPPPQELCKQLHAKIDTAEEEKYDMEIRVQKSTKEVRGGGRPGAGVGRRGAAGAGLGLCRAAPARTGPLQLEDMNQKLFDLRGKFKRPPLRRVRMSADAMLKALLGSKHKVCMDLRANLKQVKKEDTEKVGPRCSCPAPHSPQPHPHPHSGAPLGSCMEGKPRLRVSPTPLGSSPPDPRSGTSATWATGGRTSRRSRAWRAARRCSSPSPRLPAAHGLAIWHPVLSAANKGLHSPPLSGLSCPGAEPSSGKWDGHSGLCRTLGTPEVGCGGQQAWFLAFQAGLGGPHPHGPGQGAA